MKDVRQNLSEVINFRVTPADKEMLKDWGDNLGEEIRNRLGLSNGGAGSKESQAKAEGLAGSTGSSVPVAEPPDFQQRVNEHALRMPRSAAERLARKERG